MARLWSCAFGLRSVTSGVEWDTTTGSPAINTATVRTTGGASLRCNTSSSTAYITQQVYASDTVTRLYFRAYVYISSMPSAKTGIISWGDGTGWWYGVRLNPGGTLTIEAANNFLISSASSALSTGRWYRIEFDMNDNTDTHTLYVDGVQVAQLTGADVFGSRYAYFGVQDACTADLYMTDLAINDTTGTAQTGLPGDGSLAYLFPNAAGDNNLWATAVGGTAGTSNNYTRVDEVPPDDATSYNQTTVSGTTTIDDFNVDNPSLPSGSTVTLVQVGQRAGSSTTTTASIVTRLKGQSGGTVLESASIPVNTAAFNTHATAVPKLYKLTAYVNPQGSVAWTAAALANIQIGYRSNVSQTSTRRVTLIWAVAEYVAPSTTPVSGTLDLQWVVQNTVSGSMDLRWAVLNAVSGALDTPWAVRGTVAGSLDTPWAVRALVSGTLDLPWKVRNVVASSLDLRWAVQQQVGGAIDLRWAVRNAISGSLDLRWISQARVSGTLDMPWAVRNAVSSTLDLRWAVRNAVTGSIDFRWAVRNSITGAIDFRWAVLNSVSGTISTPWAVRNAVTGGLDIRWIVDSSITSVSGTLDLRWATREIVSGALSTPWAVRNLASGTLSTPWAVRNTVTGALDTPWAVRSLVAGSLDLRWAVVTATSVAGSLEMLWKTREEVSGALDVRWAVAGKVSGSLALQWNVLNAVSGTLTLPWAVRSQISGLLSTPWVVRARVVGSLHLLWVVEALIHTDPPVGDVGVHLTDRFAVYPEYVGANLEPGHVASGTDRVEAYLGPWPI